MTHNNSVAKRSWYLPWTLPINLEKFF